ncbi:MAG: HindVP family restriction endonuclease [Candidatus Poribacteria bacterium]|nr:HindVP family restriction endonuclease [Candidatus Poribacteria bacterium]
MDSRPALFALNRSNTNKDFSQAKAWGKNSFNNCFPIALLCYMQSQNIAPVYLALDGNWNVIPEKIDVNSVFGHAYDSEDIYFAFEYTYGQNQQFVKGTLPRIDLVVMDNSNSESPWLRALEIKLTALPDNSTCGFSEGEYGCELVVRPNTIIHLTLGIIGRYAEYRSELLGSLSPIFQNNFDWESEDSMLEKIPHITQTIKTLLLAKVDDQIPLVVQPIWKTIGKSSRLHENCLDVFVWSTFAFAKLLLDTVEQGRAREFSRAKRAVLWIVKMLSDFATDGKIDPQTVSVGFTRQTDKAFALSGRKTHPYMSCAELLRPRVKKNQIKNIILGQGEKLLSPERRFDAILVNSPELFT